MNETVRTIMHRRSVRAYKPDTITSADLKTIVEAGVYAPSAMNQQKWHFTVVSNLTMIEKLMEAVRQNISKSGIEFLVERAKTPGFNVFHNAPAIIIVTGEDDARFTELDCGAAAENMALAAASLGIGSCLLGMPDFAFQGEMGSQLKQELGIPANYRHVITVALGYNAGQPPQAPPKNLDVINYIA